MDAAQEKIKWAKLSVYSNICLVAMKLLVWPITGSVAVLSEALHSGIDLVAALIARYSVKKSAVPADSDHRYGHGKYENLSGMIEGALIFVAAIWIIYQASMKLVHPEPVEIVYAGMIVMGISAVVNFFVARKLSEVAKKTDSLALEADAYHLYTDVWTSAGVFVALGLIQVTGAQWLDPAVAILVAMFIVHAAYDITTRSAQGLLDKSLPEAEVKLIERIIKEHSSDILNFHRLRTRKMGSERQIDVHMVVPRDLSVKASHDIVSHLEIDIKRELPGSVIVVHVEPCNANCAECKMAPPSLMPMVGHARLQDKSNCRPKD